MRTSLGLEGLPAKTPPIRPRHAHPSGKRQVRFTLAVAASCAASCLPRLDAVGQVHPGQAQAQTQAPAQGASQAQEPQTHPSETQRKFSVPEPGFDAQRCTEHPKKLAGVIHDRPREIEKSRQEFEAGITEAQGGQHASAIERFQAALLLDPKNALAHLAKAESHLLFDNDQELMRTHLATAVLLLPSSARAHDRYAMIEDEAGSKDIAEVHWLCALELRPSFNEARLHLAKHYVKQGLLEKAETQLMQLVDRWPIDIQAHVLLAEVLEGRGEFAKAGHYLEVAADAVKSSAVFYRRAAALYERANEPAAATRMKLEADKIDPPAKDTRTLRPLRGRRSR